MEKKREKGAHSSATRPGLGRKRGGGERFSLVFRIGDKGKENAPGSSSIRHVRLRRGEEGGMDDCKSICGYRFMTGERKGRRIQSADRMSFTDKGRGGTESNALNMPSMSRGGKGKKKRRKTAAMIVLAHAIGGHRNRIRENGKSFSRAIASGRNGRQKKKKEKTLDLVDSSSASSMKGKRGSDASDIYRDQRPEGKGGKDTTR